MPSTTLTALAASLLCMSLAASAQTAPNEAAAQPREAADATRQDEKQDALKLESVVVTGASSGRSKMKSSVAVSTISTESVSALAATSAADVLRSVPGLRSESSGGESNANVGVRGIPISAGGARYIQFQEDGLPVLQFGDMAFATPDTWIRADSMLERLEVVRGGTASVLTTGAPGGIINFITKTGREQGGEIGLSLGLANLDQTRVDMSYGGRLAPKTRFQIGGFYRTGDGGRKGADGTENGGQIRANLTFELDNNSFVKLSLKHLDDHTPTFMPTPVRFVDGTIRTLPGLDPRRAAFYDVAWPMDNTLTNANGRTTSNIRDGLSASSDGFGLEADLAAGGGWRLHNKFSWVKNSGRFIGIFPGDDVSAAPAGTTIASGAGAGSAYSGNKFTAVIFNTQVDDAGLMANDLKLSRDFPLAGGKINAVAGLYHSVQQLDLTWNFNQYSLSADGVGARVLNVPGVVNGSPGFGGCCMNFQDSKYRSTSPYLVLNLEAGAFTGDLGLRRDRNQADGAYYQTLPGFGGLVAGEQYNLAAPRAIDYQLGKTSFSLGGNYQIERNLSLFARYSDGAAFNADRITFFNAANLVNGSSPTIPINKVKQTDIGAKLRGSGWSLFATLFAADTDEVNVDVTTSPIVSRNNRFKSKGLELEGSLNLGPMSLLAGLTYTDAEQADGRAPKRQAKWVYQITPTFQFGDDLMLGVGIVGTTASKDDSPAGPLTVTLPAYAMLNATLAYNLSENVTLALVGNNLTDKIAYTESNDGRGAARAHTGRTVKATLKYRF